MKTLVIHPTDKSTDFLTVIYSDLDCTVLRDNISHSKLKKLIKEQSSKGPTVYQVSTQSSTGYQGVTASTTSGLPPEKTLVVFFSDGNFYQGTFYLFKNGVATWHVSNVKDLVKITDINTIKFIKPKDVDFTYSLTSIVKFTDMTEGEFLSLKRDINIDKIIKE